MSKNNRNKWFYVLDDSYLNDNSLIKESRNLDWKLLLFLFFKKF